MLPETNEGSIALAAVDLLEVELEKMSAVIIGPGLSRNSQTAAFVHNFLPLIAKSGLPCIIDADALNAIAIAPEKFPQAGGKFVLTPHPKELSRLMQCPVSEIQKDRIASARRAAAKFACTVVLKGARTVIADANGRASINPTGNPGMATAGCGDVLSGITGGLMAQGVQPHEAALLAVYIHGMAGDIVAQARGEAGIIAGDIEEAVPTALLQIHQGSISGLEAELLGFR
jgi:NAD(P)H-hydrate epimerase